MARYKIGFSDSQAVVPGTTEPTANEFHGVSAYEFHSSKKSYKDEAKQASNWARATYYIIMCKPQAKTQSQGSLSSQSTK